jgi:uncharacterized membrane protein/YHS domain-containing protein
MALPTPISRWLAVVFAALAAVLLVAAAPDALAQGADAAGSVVEGADLAASSDSAAAAEKPVDAPGWLAFLGRFHVVVLHLPIGILIVAFILECFGMLRRSRGYDVATAWTLVIGFFTAAVAIAFGLFLEETTKPGVYDALTMDWHKWLGIAMGGLAFFAAVLKIAAVRKQWGGDDQRQPGGAPLALARLSILGVAILLPVVGHLGGNLTHGANKLVDKAPFDVPSGVMSAIYFPNDPPAAGTAGGGGAGGETPAAGTVEAQWVNDIQPIMDTHCVQCHGASKQNAGLRLDSLDEAMRGSEYGPVVVKGSAEESRLYQVVCLPPEDDYFMPPGKAGLSLEEMRTVARWLIASVDLGKAPAGGSADRGGGPETPAGPAYDVEAYARLNELGGRAQIVSEGSDLLILSFANQRGPIPDEAFAAIEALADHVQNLDFSNSGVTDADLDRLPDMPALERLYLKDTEITDEGIANLPELFSLSYLNLFGSNVTDASMDNLSMLVVPGKDGPGSIYLSETGVTLEGVEQLRDALGDGVEVVFDDSVGLLDTPGADAGADAGADGPTVPVNTACPVSGTAVDPAHTVTYEGRVIGFCCPNCLAKFEEDATPFLTNLPQ